MYTRSMMLGMLRQGNTGEQILNILETIYQDIRTEVCESEGVANCPEEDDYITELMNDFNYVGCPVHY